MKLKPFLRPTDSIDSKREEILNAAQEVFADVGFKEATIRQICKKAHANVCLVSYYFGGKDGLYRAIFERVGEARVREAEKLLGNLAAIASGEEYKARFKFVMERLYAELSSKPQFMRLMNREMIDNMPRVSDVIEAYIGTAKKKLMNFIEFGQKKKYLRDDIDSEMLAMAMINTFIGFILHQGKFPELFFAKIPHKELPARIVETVSRIFMEGAMLQ